MSKAGDLLDSMASEQSLWAEQRDALEAQAKSVDPAIVFTVAAVVFAAPHT